MKLVSKKEVKNDFYFLQLVSELHFISHDWPNARLYFSVVFRVETGRWKLFLLSLPFVKIIFDFARGVPEKSILFSGVDPFNLPPKHQLLSIGAGFDGWTPYLSTVFSVNAPNGKSYNSSLGDFFLFWIHRNYGSNTPLLIVSSVLAISFVLLTIRMIQYYRFEKKRRAERARLFSLKTIKAGSRSVDVYIS